MSIWDFEHTLLDVKCHRDVSYKDLHAAMQHVAEHWADMTALKKQVSELQAELERVMGELEDARAEAVEASVGSASHFETCPVCDGTGRCSCSDCSN